MQALIARQICLFGTGIDVPLAVETELFVLQPAGEGERNSGKRHRDIFDKVHHGASPPA
ncbi:hypothetical protein HY36_11840 [Hyphomonas atlantica]|uniref:Uncharacterized protein n=1 Tax=Hyphomonas atlantica TaxID=1280948 RepID=A0A059DWV7_9PROT|nr:hypothetical protein HY36_11840 [Hyphomonas atlantica]